MSLPGPTELHSLAIARGFHAIGVTDVDLDGYGDDFREWLAAGFHGSMDYMARHAALRLNPARLLPGTIRVVSARMNYQPPETSPLEVLDRGDLGYVARYALGRDYHKKMRKALARLAADLHARVHETDPIYRAFADSAPVLEKPFAEKAGLGWIGKNTLLLSKEGGSWFFLGEIFTNAPLTLTTRRHDDQCGACRACLTVCPTGALVGPGRLDARRCIAYLTIESKEPIPEALRPAIGNRIFGCDDCQLFCPWNRSAPTSTDSDFTPRHRLDRPELLSLWGWDEQTFLARTEGSAIRRIHYDQWRRNLAVALGNGPADPDVIRALRADRDSAPPLVREHIDWALDRLTNGPAAAQSPSGSATKNRSR